MKIKHESCWSATYRPHEAMWRFIPSDPSMTFDPIAARSCSNLCGHLGIISISRDSECGDVIVTLDATHWYEENDPDVMDILDCTFVDYLSPKSMWV